MLRTNEPDPSGSPVCDWTGGEPSRRSTPSPHRSRKSIAGSGMEGARSDGMRDYLVIRSEKTHGRTRLRRLLDPIRLCRFARVRLLPKHEPTPFRFGKSSVKLSQTNICSWKNRKCGLWFPCAPARIRITSLRGRGRMPRRPQFLWQSYLRQSLVEPDLRRILLGTSNRPMWAFPALTGSRRKE